jgi:tetratricopeptide (TPR) repeat protein
MKSHWIPILACALGVFVGDLRTARADDDDGLRELRVRFAEGQLYEAAGRWADGLSRFQDVGRVRNTPQVKFHTALCLEHLGRFLEAEQLYRSAKEAAGATAPHVVTEADSHLADLAERMPKVSVGVSGELRGLKILIDAVPVTSANGIVRVDPGPHLLTAVRDGRTVSALAFSILERRNKSLTLTVYPDHQLVATR